MTFEEEIAQAFETLTDRLRAGIDQEVERRAAEIVAAAPAPVTVAEPTPVNAVAQPAFDADAAARLTDAVRSIDAARSLTGILDALLSAARAEATSADIWLNRSGRRHQWRSPESSDAVQDTPSGSLIIPVVIAGAEVAALYAEPRTENRELCSHNLELLTRYAARVLESLTAFTTARALTQRTASPDTAADAADGDEVAAEEDTSARRYARLLVSGIKLYHESAVADGRRDRDLATRLGGEIARARVMYEQRVPPHVRRRADHFHDELLRTLANGDAGLLEIRSEK